MATSNFRTMDNFPLIVAAEGMDGDCGIVCDMETVAEELNAEQPFFKVSVKGGYYEGCQFFVEEKYEGLCRWGEEDAQDEFGKPLDEVLREYEEAFRSVKAGLESAKKGLGLVELAVSARFSNGETWYRKVG